MSNRVIGQKKSDYRDSPKPQQKFIPKRDFQNPNNSPQTLSNSFRSATSGGDAVVASTSRVGMGEDGELRVKKSPASGNFVIYLPQDEAVAVGLGPEDGGLDPVESQHVVDLLNRELSRLLKSRPRDFWREVATDESLHSFLESFLKFKSRWHDFPYRGARGIVAGVIVGELELCRRVFMVLYRFSSNRDPGAKAADTLSVKDHAALLQDKKLLDLPKLLDICAIYGHENEDLTRILVLNAMKAQPNLQDGFPVLMSHFLSILHTMYQRCSSSLEVLFSSGGQDQGSNRLHFDYLEVMDFINDAVVSIDSFVNAYKHAAVFFSSPVETSSGNEELLTVLGRLHDSLLPSLQKGFVSIFATLKDKKQEMPNELRSNIFISLKMLSSRIAKLGWKLLYFCYLSDEAFESSNSLPVSMKMFPANVEDPVVRADILTQSIRGLCEGSTHVPAIQTWGTFLQNIEKNHKIMSRIELLLNTGWISMDDEQFQFLAGITMRPLETGTKAKSSASLAATGNGSHTDENAAIMESKISQIKELFPDYGRGFLVACLEAYNHDAEEVIQRILEGTLHEDLLSLDISLERIPPSKSTPSVSRNDKGKGKLVESSVPPPDMASTVLKDQAKLSSSTSSSVGRFVRKNMDKSPDFETLNAKKDKELAKTTALISQLEYEDEYDDSFDDLGLSVQDSGLDEPETLNEKMHSRRGRSTEADDSSSTSNPQHSKWNSLKKPQYYVKDGKNYSYKVDGSVAVSNYNEAKLVNLSQKELIHGLGRGGNIPLGAVKRLTEANEEQDDGQDSNEVGGRGSFRGRGRRGYHSGVDRKPPPSSDEHGDGRGTDEAGGSFRGRGRRGYHSGANRQPTQSRDEHDDGTGTDETGGSFRGRGRRGYHSGGTRNPPQASDDHDDATGTDEFGGRGGRGDIRGGGRRGRGRNSFIRDRAMSKHLSGLPGHYNS